MSWLISLSIGMIGLVIVGMLRVSTVMAFAVGWLLATLSLMLQTYLRTGHL